MEISRYKYKIEGDVVRITFTDKDRNEHEALIDEANLDKFVNFKYKWGLRYYKNIQGFYVAATEYLGIDSKPMYRTVLLHKYLTNSPNELPVDHINGNTLDNRLENLRIVNHTKNLTNRRGANRNSSTGVRNVSYSRTEGKYVVQLQVDGKNTLFGKFDNLEDASRLAEKKREEIYGELLKG